MDINDRICVKACLDHYYMIQRFDLRKAWHDMLEARTENRPKTAEYFRVLCRACARCAQGQEGHLRLMHPAGRGAVG